ncbi:MAG: hypothetical protein JXR88_05585 [Clostridia bacterium]|nr:hypothetical protein [Clostridia bacterium]
MFEINEMKLITRLIGTSFYISQKTTLEYILYQDIDYYEIIVEFEVETWIKGIQKLYALNVIKNEKNYKIDFLDERFTLSMTQMKFRDYIEKVKLAEFNIESVVIKISDHHENSFNKYHYKDKVFYARWIDPYHKRMSIRANLIEPINMSYITNQGNLIYKMIHLMAKYSFDLHEETIAYLKNQKQEITYTKEDLSYEFFKILSYSHASKYIHLLNNLGALEKHYPLIQAMQSLDFSIFSKGLKSLEILESIMIKTDYFNDSIYRVLKQNLNKTFQCGLSRLQLLKFSVLFYNAHLCMNLKQNAPERYEPAFLDFCNYFHLGEEACYYYSQVVQNNRYTFLDIREELINQWMDLEEQYNFFEEFNEYTIDVLLIQYIDLISEKENEIYLKKLESYMLNYISKFVEIQSINSEITTLEIHQKISDAKMLILLDEVKAKVFLGNLRYDRSTIIDYINKAIEQTL